MGRACGVLVAGLILTSVLLACVGFQQEEQIELRPTLILTPYATATPTLPPSPTPAPTLPPTATPETFVYKVKPGDTLSGIAARFGISSRELMRLNGLTDGDLITVGQELRVPKR